MTLLVSYCFRRWSQNHDGIYPLDTEILFKSGYLERIQTVFVDFKCVKNYLLYIKRLFLVHCYCWTVQVRGEIL